MSYIAGSILVAGAMVALAYLPEAVLHFSLPVLCIATVLTLIVRNKGN